MDRSARARRRGRPGSPARSRDRRRGRRPGRGVRARARRPRAMRRCRCVGGAVRRAQPRAARTAARCRDWCCSRRRRSVRVTASRMRAPTAAPGVNSAPAAASRAGDELRGASCRARRCPTLTLPGLRVSTSSSQARRKQPRAALRVERSCIAQLAQRDRRAARPRACDRAGRRRARRRCRAASPIAALPRRDAVHFEHERPRSRRRPLDASPSAPGIRSTPA